MDAINHEQKSTTNNFVKLSVVIPCYNEENTLKKCVEKVVGIGDEQLLLEIIIIDDFSTDNSINVAYELENKYEEVMVLAHNKNKGKGAALRTGFQKATGDIVAVQDADLEYNPRDLKKLLSPIFLGQFKPSFTYCQSISTTSSRHTPLYLCEIYFLIV